jgi:hypothetical protein
MFRYDKKSICLSPQIIVWFHVQLVVAPRAESWPWGHKGQPTYEGRAVVIHLDLLHSEVPPEAHWW